MNSIHLNSDIRINTLSLLRLGTRLPKKSKDPYLNEAFLNIQKKHNSQEEDSYVIPLVLLCETTNQK
ncbi:MAG: hypothetical protein F2759_02080 [Actinobacteria bacterium]|nr:hypothetical protein [Actinomycetota bacterium]